MCYAIKLLPSFCHHSILYIIPKDYSNNIKMSSSYSSEPSKGKVLTPPQNEEESDDIDDIIERLQYIHDGDDDLFEEEADAGHSSRPVPSELLQTDPTRGLTNEEFYSRRKRYGWNKMSEEEESLIIKFLLFFVGPIQFVMEAAAILAAGLKDWADFNVIVGLLGLNAAVGFLQEFQTGSIVKELKKTLVLTAIVLREGHLQEIEAVEIVPSDMLQVEKGIIISADGSIVTEKSSFQIDQSSITGESLDVSKHVGKSTYASPTVKRGGAFMVVTATGDNTFVGQVATLVNKASGNTGHFTKVLNNIGIISLILVIVTLLVVWTASFYRSNSIVEIL